MCDEACVVCVTRLCGMCDTLVWCKVLQLPSSCFHQHVCECVCVCVCACMRAFVCARLSLFSLSLSRARSLSRSHTPTSGMPSSSSSTSTVLQPPPSPAPCDVCVAGVPPCGLSVPSVRVRARQVCVPLSSSVCMCVTLSVFRAHHGLYFTQTPIDSSFVCHTNAMSH
jgi:hypothetical protein